MSETSWPHAHLPHAVADYLKDTSPCEKRVTTGLPRNRVHPLATVQQAGLGPLGTDSAIQADEVRLQLDVWAKTREEALAIAAGFFRLLDARFDGALRFTTLRTEDEASPGDYYLSDIEWIHRSGGGDVYFDEIAQVYRSTAFYNAKLQIG